MKLFREFLGAFSDAAVLFPLLALLSVVPGFSGGSLLLSTGLAYLGAAWLFGIPMSVQPLKSITVSAVALGASALEIRLSGLLLGMACLGVLFFNVEKLSNKVPVAVIHQLQAGLGVLLMLQGFKAGWSWPLLTLAGVMVAYPEIRGVPVLGLVAVAGVGWGILGSESAVSAVPGRLATEPVREGMVMSLVLPQIVLTWANSVLATRNVCESYFGPRAARVTVRRLLASIGLGNIVYATIGGMPFCHGSGGVTAHVRGGASLPGSTAFFGIFLTILALVHWATGRTLVAYPPQLICPLLLATGVFHLKLAAPTTRSKFGTMKILVAMGLTLISGNLLWALAAAVSFELIERLLGKRTFQEAA